VRTAGLPAGRLISILALAFLAFARSLYAQPAATSHDAQESGKPAPVTFVWKKPPSLRLGDVARIDFRFKMHSDLRGFSPDLRRQEQIDMRRVRPGIEGTFLKDFEYEVEYDFREADYPLRDAFLNYRRWRPLQIRAGKFKIPFSRDALTGAMNLDFAFRSRAADELAPGRDIGVMAHGRVLDRRVAYQFGAFRQDGENARTDDRRRLRVARSAREHTWAARATIDAGRLGSSALKDLELGIAMTTGIVPEGRNGLRGRMALAGAFFQPVDVSGRRQRLGLEVTWTRKPFSARGEFMRARDERRGQGLEGDDLSPVIAQGWYLAGTWMVAGARPGDGNGRRSGDARFGAVELTARHEGARFTSRPEGDMPSRSPRASFVVPNADRASTFGFNWYVNQFFKLQGNAIQERVDDPGRTPIPDRTSYWSTVLRLQFVL
jgi:phosphate-selective porin